MGWPGGEVSVGPVAVALTGRENRPMMLSAWPVTVTVVSRVGARGGDVGADEHAGAELVEDALALVLAGRGGLALETGDGDALLGDGRGDVLGVLPEGELDHPHDQQQQQWGGDHQFGRAPRRVRLGTGARRSRRRGPRVGREASGREPPRCVGSPPAAGGDVVGRRDDLGHDDPDRGERQSDEQGGHDDGLGGVAGFGVGSQRLPPDGEGLG